MQEILHLVDNGRLKFGLRVGGFRFQPQEFQGNWILDQVGWLLNHIALVGKAHHFLLVPAQRDTFIEAAVNLALKLAYVPVALETFYLIEFAGILVFDPHKYQVMRPIQHKFWSPGRLV